jgi:hypothetical protein
MFAVAGALMLVPYTFPVVMAAGTGAIPQPRAAIAAPTSRLDYPAYVVKRDPFAAPAVAAMPGSQDNASTMDDKAALERVDASPVLRAIVLGASPKALIDIGGHTSLVGVGSPLAGSRIVAIQATGIELADGSRLKLLEATP